MDRSHFHHRTRPRVGGEIAGEFAERAFRQHLAGRREMAFEDDLRLRRERQAGHGSGKNRDRRALDGAGEVVFADAFGQVFEARDEQRGVFAIDHRDRARHAAVAVFFCDDGAVAAGMVELNRDLVPPVDLDAINRGVDPAVVGIAHDDEAAGADVGAAIIGVPHRRGKFVERDIAAAHGIFEPCRFRGLDRSARRQRPALLHPRLERVERSEHGIDAERERGALRVRHRIGEDASAGGKSLDAVEQQRRTRGKACRDLGDAADLVMGIGAVDAAQRAQRINRRDESAKVLIHEARSPGCFR
jgi:hypothetical protein